MSTSDAAGGDDVCRTEKIVCRISYKNENQVGNSFPVQGGADGRSFLRNRSEYD